MSRVAPFYTTVILLSFFLYYIKVGSKTTNNNINVVKEVRELFNEVRSNFSHEEANRIRKGL